MRIKFLWLILFSLLQIIVLSYVIPLSADAPKDKKSSAPAPTAPVNKIYLINVDAPITPVVSEYIIKSIDTASRNSAEAIIIQLDTPGGLVDSMREIVKKMLSADIPVVVYVAPAGARAASAGVFITIAANVAAMAPSTHIGAAHPVTMEGKMDKTMEAKVVNDLAAMARSIAEKRGRNAKWVEDAVRKSVSITETEALKERVIDLVAPDVPSLLKEINGKSVDLVVGKKTIDTSNAQVQEINMGFRHRILEIISNPNIAYILMILGFYGLYFELANPGAVFPGVAGAISLILAFYALHTLPINYAGLMLIILGVGLFIAEAFITSHGVLGVGGAIAMAIGSVMLIESPSPYLRISWAVIVPVVALSALLFIITVTMAVRVHREKADTGKEGMLGLEGEAKTDISTGGQIFVRGEYWNAWSESPIQKGERVKVEAVEGLKLKVKRAD
ncbi:MAG TPA: nodulation protein NfeD [Nitrospirota bacterium]|nr:nodulation protein NfeD [Nitrospirota bacterium]